MFCIKYTSFVQIFIHPCRRNRSVESADLSAHISKDISDDPIDDPNYRESFQENTSQFEPEEINASNSLFENDGNDNDFSETFPSIAMENIPFRQGSILFFISNKSRNRLTCKVNH